MAEFVPIDPTGKSTDELVREIAITLNKTHECVHLGQAEQARRDAEAAEKRNQMGNTIASIQGSVRNLFKKVGGLESTQTIDSGRIDKLSKMFGAEKVKKGEEKPKGSTVASWSSWKAITAWFGALSGVILFYKIIVPLLEPVFRAIHHAIMAAS